MMNRLTKKNTDKSEEKKKMWKFIIAMGFSVCIIIADILSMSTCAITTRKCQRTTTYTSKLM